MQEEDTGTRRRNMTETGLAEEVTKRILTRAGIERKEELVLVSSVVEMEATMIIVVREEYTTKKVDKVTKEERVD